MKGLKSIWETVLADIRSGVNKKEYSLWLGVLSLRDISENTAFISAPDRFVAEWSSDNYLEKLKISFRKVAGSITDVIIYPQSLEKDHSCLRNKRLNTSPGHKASSNLSPGLTFSSFIATAGNKAALAASRQVSTSTGYMYNPLFVFCKQPAGKTHLLNAIGNSIIADQSLKPPLYISAKNHKWFSLYQIGDDYEAISALLLDDIESLCLKKSAQERFTGIFDKLHSAGVRLVFAGKMLPNEIPGLIPSLISRLEWGLLCEIGALDTHDRYRILKSRSSKGSAVRDSTLKDLASASTDITVCLRRLIRLEASFSLNRNSPDLEVIDTSIKESDETPEEISIKDILSSTSTYFDIPIDKIISNSRSRSISYPRHLAIFLSRKLCGTAYSEIAYLFSNRHISTIIYSVKRIESMAECDPQARRDLSEIREMIYAAGSLRRD
jgi:chromosomal replication initiator protein